MRYQKTLRKAHAISRISVRGLFVTAGILCLLVLTLSSFAINGPAKKQVVSGKNESKPIASQVKAVIEPIPLAAPSPKPAGNLDQVRNGGVGCDDTVPNSCENPADWVNGNAGASNAHYNEGESIPYRMVLTGLAIGPTHNVVIEWDITHGGANAIDFITHYQQGVSESVIPCGSAANHPEDVIAGCNPGVFDIANIPAPTGINSPVAGQPAAAFAVVPAGQRVMTIYNGTINDTDLTYVFNGDLSQAQSATRMNIAFTNTTSTVVLAWGGHIARGVDWNGSSASAISGSPYHTRLISLDGSGGNQDRSLSALAVAAPQGCTLSNGTPNVCDGSIVTHTATAIAGQTYSFSLVNNGGNAAIVPGTLDEDPAGGTVSAQVQTSGAGSYTLTLTTTTAGGTETCSAIVNVHQPPAADAGNASYEHCITDGLAFTMSDSSATVPSDGALTWSVTGGATISDIHALHPVITLTGAGTVTATLTVTGDASCGNATDTTTLTVSSEAVAAAGPDQTVCASSPAVTLAGSFSGSATSASWSGGAGSFNPNANTLNAVYTPSAGEISAGSVTLTLTTNDPNGSCGADTDTMTITINPNPTVEISLVDACASTAHLHATVTGGNGTIHYTWKKDNVATGTDSADLTLTGPGTYTVSVTDSSVPSCGSNTDTFVVCYTEGPAASLQVKPNSINAAVKPKSESAPFVARMAYYLVSAFATAIF